MTAERPGIPGAAWETELRRMAEVVVPEDEGSPLGWDEPGGDEHRPNRATRRAARAAGRRTGVRTDTETPNPPTQPHAGTQPFDK